MNEAKEDHMQVEVECMQVEVVRMQVEVECMQVAGDQPDSKGGEH